MICRSFCGAESVFSVIFMDLDRFKQINDQYGHMVGDQYLKHFAEICTGIFQEIRQSITGLEGMNLWYLVQERFPVKNWSR